MPESGADWLVPWMVCGRWDAERWLDGNWSFKQRFAESDDWRALGR